MEKRNFAMAMLTIFSKLFLYPVSDYIAAIIEGEGLKPDEARKFMDNAFRDGTLKTTGTDIDKILPPVSRFSGGGRTAKKQGIIEKLLRFFEKYFGLA